MRGRKPIPTAAKRLAGTLRKDRMNREEPVIEAGIPSPPADLDAQVRAQWDYYVPILSGCRVLTLADRETLLCYCAAAARRNQAEKELAKDGPVVKSPSGYSIQNPFLSIANKAMEQMLKWGQELGLSPSSRTRIKTATPAKAAETGAARFFKTVG